MDVTRTVQDIQYVLAPAVMVSSSALLLLGFNNKFSNLANRFRALNQEKRTLASKSGANEAERARLSSLEAQVAHLMHRATLVKNAILFTYGGIVCFTGTSVMLFLNIYTPVKVWDAVVAVFLAGLICIFCAALWMIRETGLFYKVISLEHKS